MVAQRGYYAPVRQTEGREWISPNELASLLGIAQNLAFETERKCGEGWAKANPVVRIARVEIVEIAD